jgi:hypothetical protein
LGGWGGYVLANVIGDGENMYRVKKKKEENFKDPEREGKHDGKMKSERAK